MNVDRLTDEQIDPPIRAALAEDTSRGDITSDAVIPPGLYGKAQLLVKQRGVLAGAGVAARVFHLVDPALEITHYIEDGSVIEPGDVITEITGSVASILKAERTALNFIQRLSGIATMTARYVAETQDLKARIYDTRKTTPGLRLLEKYAVRLGGGTNHRLDLSDGILIKDNHVAALRATGLSVKDIVTRARKNAPAGTTIEVEVTAAKEAAEALKAGADVIMLDNMDASEMKQAVNMVHGRTRLEASGGITLENVHQVAMTGVDIISIGALTHSVKSLDISLEVASQTLNLL
jgi:nicotinate-nucleotide pyrophosphorylase (carboxylating)